MCCRRAPPRGATAISVSAAAEYARQSPPPRLQTGCLQPSCLTANRAEFFASFAPESRLPLHRNLSRRECSNGNTPSRCRAFVTDRGGCYLCAKSNLRMLRWENPPSPGRECVQLRTGGRRAQFNRDAVSKLALRKSQRSLAFVGSTGEVTAGPPLSQRTPDSCPGQSTSNNRRKTELASPRAVRADHQQFPMF